MAKMYFSPLLLAGGSGNIDAGSSSKEGAAGGDSGNTYSTFVEYVLGELGSEAAAYFLEFGLDLDDPSTWAQFGIIANDPSTWDLVNDIGT